MVLLMVLLYVCLCGPSDNAQVSNYWCIMAHTHTQATVYTTNISCTSIDLTMEFIIRKTCPCNIIIPPYTPLLNSKVGVCKGIPIFLIFAPKHRLWVHVRTASARRF